MRFKLGEANGPPPPLKVRVTVDEVKIFKQEILKVV